MRSATCVGYGIEHDKVHHKGCTTPACVWCLSYFICLPFCYLGPKLRKEVRGQYNLPAEPCGGALCEFVEHDLSSVWMRTDALDCRRI